MTGPREGGPWRLVVDGAADGAWNMAVDEALLERYAGPDPPPAPTLRLYGWKPPALSLGRKQPAAGAHDPEYLRAEKIELVRRPTGGRAVLHEQERTYAVVGRLRYPPFQGGVLDTYARIAAALLASMRRLGIDAAVVPPHAGGAAGPDAFPVCFDGPAAHEITVGGRKIVGSAQLRRREGFLQHGSILLRADADRLTRAIGVPADPTRFTDLRRALGRLPDPADVDAALVAGFEEAFDAPLERGELTEEESFRAAALRCWKYDSLTWTLAGRLGERERRWGPATVA